MSRKLNVSMNGKDFLVEEGTRISELIAKAPHLGPHKAIGAVVNNHPVGMNYRLKSAAKIATIDYSTREGMDIYRRTASLILYSAIADIAPAARVVVGQSIGSGYFFEIHDHLVEETFLNQLESRMREIVNADIGLNREWVTIEEAMEIFREHKQPDKVKLTSQLKRSEIPMVSLGNYRGYGYGPVAYRTSLIDKFALRIYEHGIVLNFPDSRGSLAKKHPEEKNLFNTYLEAKRWNELIKIENVADLNEHCMGRTAGDLVKVAEALHEKKIAAIADQIAATKNVRLVLIAGPSGSGKTTFSKRLSIHLKIHGIEPVAISIDNYYKDREQSPRHPNGDFDFEHIDALDLKLFNEHVSKLLHGEEVDIPYYSFPLGKRDESRSKKMRLGKHQILITEGIHGLNDKLSESVATSHKFKIYVSALTQLCLDNHNRIFTTDTRLCRRIVRDRLYRGTTAAETIAGWTSVRTGENKYIFPYQESANVIFNSALPYEHSLLKPYAERYLAEVPREHTSYMEAYRLSKFFSFFIPILSREVPHNSILREFIGGSAFSYS